MFWTWSFLVSTPNQSEYSHVFCIFKFPNRRFRNFCNSFLLSFSKAWKVKYLHHLWINHRNIFCEVWPKTFELHKIHIRQNDRKGRYTLAQFWEKCKKVTGPEKPFWWIYKHSSNVLFWILWSKFYLFFLQFSQKCALRSFFKELFVAQTPIIRFFVFLSFIQMFNKYISTPSTIVILWIFLWYWYLSRNFVKKKYKSNHQKNSI